MITNHDEEVRGMKLFSTQKSPVKEESPSACSNEVNASQVRRIGLRDQVGFHGFGNNDIREFRVPVEALRSFRFIPRFMVQSKEEELLLCISELFFFLRRLELDLVDLCLKDSVDLRKLSVLADEVTELKCVAREALAYFHEAAKAVESPFQPSGNDSSESVDESQDDCGTNSDGYSFNDVGPVDSFKHGKKCTQ